MKVPGINIKEGLLKEIKAGLNMALTHDDLLGIRRSVVETVSEYMTGRKLLPVEKRPMNEEFHSYYTQTEPHDAKISTRRGKARTSEDEPLILPVASLPYVKIEAEFKIHKLDLNSTLDAKTRTIKSAARLVAEAENELIFNGCTLPAINGLIAGAGNTDAATGAWSGFPGAGDPYDDILDLVTLIRADGFQGPYAMVLEPVQYGEAQIREVKAGGSAKPMLELMEAALIKDGPVQIDSRVPHGTAVVMQRGADIANLLVAEDATVYLTELDEMTEEIKGVVREAVLPRIYQANAIGTETGC